MTRRVRPSYAATLAAVVSLCALGACGGEDPPAEPAASPTSTPTAGEGTPSAPATSETASGDAAQPGTPAPESTPLDAAGFAAVVQAGLDAGQGADLTVDSGLGLLSAEGRIDLRAEPASLDLTLTSSETGDGQPIDLLVVDGVLYLADGGRFLAVEVDSASNPFGAALTDQLDPRTVLGAVQASYQSGEDLGTVEQDGQQLSLYRATADGPSVLAAIAPDLAGQPDVVVPAEVTAEVGVDDDGLARRIQVDLGADNGSLVYVLEGWSAEIAVPAPPASRVDDLDLPG